MGHHYWYAAARRAAHDYAVLVQVMGIYFLVAGFVNLVRLFVDRTAWVWKLASAGQEDLLQLFEGDLLIFQEPLRLLSV